MCIDGLPEQACQEAVALQLGRDVMSMGLVPFLTKLVGKQNVITVFERHARWMEDEAAPCPYTHAHTRHWCGYPECRGS